MSAPSAPSASSQPSPAPAPRAKRRSWWKKLLLALAVLLLLLVVFHRPIIFALVKFAAHKAGQSQGLDIDFQIHGTIFTGLQIQDLRVTPTRPGPIEKANVGLLEVHYSLPTLIRGGLASEFLSDVKLHDVDVVFDPSKSPPSPPKKKEAFKLPSLAVPKQLSLRNINFRMKAAPAPIAEAQARAAATSPLVPAPVAPAVAGTTEAVVDRGLVLSGFNLDLDPQRSGALHIGELRIPGGPDLRDVSAGSTFRNRNLQLTDLALAPEIRFRSLGLDASRLPQQILTVSLDGDFFGGSANAAVQLTGIGVPPKASVKLDAKGISFASVHDFLKMDAPLGGSLDSLSMRFDGASDQPKTWTGQIDGRIVQPAFGTTALDGANLRIRLHDGLADLEQSEVFQGANRVAVQGRTELPAKIEDLSRTGGGGKINITVPDFAKLPVKLPVELTGSLNAQGNFKLAQGRFTSDLAGRIAAFSVPQQQASVAGIDFKAEISKDLPADATAPAPAPNTPAPPPKPFFDGLRTRVSADIEQIQFGAYKIDGVKLRGNTDQAQVNIEQAEIVRGDNHLNLDANYQLPADFAYWQKNPLQLRLNVDLPKLGQFSADQAAAPLQGAMNAKGAITMRDGVYTGDFNLGAHDIQAQGARVESANVQVALENNRATFHDSHIRIDEKNTIDLDGSAALQAPYPFQGGVTVNLTDLSSFEPILRAKGVEANLAGSVRLSAHGNGHFGEKNQALTGGIDLTARDLRAKGARIESVDARVVIQDNRAVIQTGQVRLDAKSALTFGGNVDLRAPYAYQGQVKLDLPDLAAFEPMLRANGVDEKLGGSINVTAKASGTLPSTPQANDQTLDGSVQITAVNLQGKGAKIERIDGLVAIDKSLAYTKMFQIRFNEKNNIELGAYAGLQEPHDYQANLNLNLLDLKAFEPILRAAQAKSAAVPAAPAKPKTPPPAANVADKAAPVSPQGAAANAEIAAARAAYARRVAAAHAADPKNKAAKSADAAPADPKLAGALQVQWVAGGNLAKDPEQFRFSGGGKIAAHQVEFNAVGPVEAAIEGGYSSDAINFPTIKVSSNGLDLGATLALKNSLLRLDNLKLRQGQTELLAGYAQIPFDPKKLSAPEGPIPDIDQIDVNIASKPLALETLYASIDKSQPAPAAGTLELMARVQGRISKTAAEIKVQARQLRAAGKPGISPADADVTLQLRDDRLSLDAVLRQPQIQPLTVRGNLPFALETIVSDKKLDPDTPVALTIQLPRSSLGFLARAVPGIRFIEGDVAVDIRVAGTIAKPDLSGQAQLNIPAVRAENITVPAVRDFQARLAFSQKQLRIERFGGEVGGGKFALDGRVDFVTLRDPVIQLAIKADNVLAKRDDNVTARVNADVKVNGPLDSATVAGYVGITKSRYLKDIDIVPIGLPGKPAPAPPAAASSSSSSSISVDVPPVNNWKFDLVIKTDDPFFVRGNLANGQAQVDLRLRGTGAKPLLDGTVTVENLVASLPFSRLEISSGNINFTPDQPLNPVVDLRGASTIRNYLVTVYISGRAKDPKILFTSEPPLPQEQIVSLLATGATTDELTGNTEALAGKATLLVLQDLYRRTFKKKGASKNAEPQSTLSDRVNFDLGEVDPSTGKQQVGARFKITDQVQFLGDLGIEGDIRGRVKYLVRFR